MSTTEQALREAADELKRLTKQQFEEVEPEMRERIAKGLGIADLTEKAERLNGDVAKTIERQNTLAADLAAEKKALTDRLDEFERKYAPETKGRRGGATLGARFMKAVGADDPATYARYEAQSKIDKTRIPAGDYLTPPSVKAVISGDAASAGDLQDSYRIPGVIAPNDVGFAVQDLLPRTSIDNRSVDYVRETLRADNAGPVAESVQGSAVNKPEGNFTFDLVSETMRTIAEWVPASRQILRYSNRTQLQSYINNRLRYEVMLELERQVLLGSGVGQDLNGLVTQAAAYDRGYANIGGAAPTQIDTLRRAITQVRESEYSATGIVLAPADWEAIELTKGSDLHYVFAMPGTMAAPRLWGRPVAETTVMTEGEFLVGAFALGAELFVGEDFSVYVGREHASYLVQNLVAILGEMDALLAVYRPEAFVTGSFEAVSS